ncbi:MAG: hypothetical protein AB7L90_07235 [Hyphomicrobiaceae bacterium]|uniref:hypothetical protein n=1 Tax=Pseudorhodoplanes sp. TaxID=1934341 RepID=UPI003D10CBE5
MSKHFNLMEFLRKAPNELLQLYCEREGILGGFAWEQRKQTDAEKIATALAAEGKGVTDRVKIHFRMLWDISGRGFTHGALNEAKFWGDDEAATTIKQLKSHLAKAFWTTLERPNFVKNAKILSAVDALPDGAWVKRGGLPARPGPVDEAVVASLEASLVEFFTRTEYRGDYCKIDAIRRGGEEIFHAYAADHPDSDMFWRGSQLEAQVFNPSIRLIFKHDDVRRTLDIHVSDDRRKIPVLQQLFARAVLAEEIPEVDPSDSPIYRIDHVLENGFEFEYSPDLGIADVRVVKARFVLEGEPWRRFLVEADNAKVRNALTALVDQLTQELRKVRPRLRLDQIHLKVAFVKQPDERRGKIRDCIITDPNVLRLKKDDLGEKIEAMLMQSGIECSDEDEAS